MNILVVKTSSIGDIIQTFPVLEYLKSRFPEASIDWVVEHEYKGLVEAHPLVRRVITLGTRRWRDQPFASIPAIKDFLKTLRHEKYDLLFDLQGNTKSSFVTVSARAEEKVGLGWKSVPELPNFFTTSKHVDVDPDSQVQQRYLQVVKRYLHDEEEFIPQGIHLILKPEENLDSLLVHARPRIMVACSSRWPNKMISSETLKEFLARILEGYFYLIWGSEAEKKVAEEIQQLFPGRSQVVGGLSFPLWQALMREMDLVVAADSAALALCGTTQTPSLSFFGPSLASIYKPLGDHHAALQGSCPYAKTFNSRCPLLRSCKTGACLKNVSADQLIELYRTKKVKSM